MGDQANDKDLLHLRKEMLEFRKDLSDMAKTVHDSLLNRVAETQELKTKVDSNAGNVKRALKVIDGNNRLPISERVANVELLQERLTDSSEKQERKFEKLNWWIIGLLVGLVTSLSATVVALLQK